MFLDEKIACGECQTIARYKAGIFEAILGVERTVDGTAMTTEVFASDEYQVVYFQSHCEMGGVLELVAYVASQVRYMPAHAQGSHRTQYATGIEFPGVIGIIQVAMWGEVVVGDHRALLHPSFLCRQNVTAFAQVSSQ